VRNASGAVTSETTLGNPISVTQTTYDVMGRVLRTAIGDGVNPLRSTLYGYDVAGRLVATQNLQPLARAAYNDALQDGTVERIGYSVEDEVVTRRIDGDNGAGARIPLTAEVVEYNTAGLPRFVHRLATAQATAATTTIPALNATDYAQTETKYDHAARALSVTEEGITPTTMTYDGFGLIQSENGTNRRNVTLNPSALQATVVFVNKATGAGAVQTSAQVIQTLDGVGRPVSIARRDLANTVTRTETRSYDPLGRLSSSVDATGRGVNVKYDVASRVTQVVEKQNATVDRARSFTYDTLGRTLSETVTDLSNALTPLVAPPTTYEYDQAGRIRYERQGTTPTDVVSEMVYDAAGRTQLLWRIVNGKYPSGDDRQEFCWGSAKIST
jgi:YD repeat-containing protein